MEVVRYSFSGWTRRPVPAALNAVRPYGGEVLYYTLPPEEGGESIPAPVIEQVSLCELLERGDVWAADAWLADEATLGLDAAVKDYAASLVRLTSPEECPRYTHTRITYCWCGCGKIEEEKEIVTTEILLRPFPPRGWEERPWCNYRDPRAGDFCMECYGLKKCPWRK